MAEMLRRLGEPAYRASQLAAWLYARRARSFDEMTDLPAELRRKLAKRFSISRLKAKDSVTSPEDGATKYLLELADGKAVESVLLPHPRGMTLCLSTQVGCGFRCRFCATAKMGLKRNLSPGEIVDQVSFIEGELKSRSEDTPKEESTRPFSNIVFMGMGEPFANYANLMSAIEILINEVGIGARRLTVSTCGVPEKIIALAEQPYEVGLAISINSPFDERRRELMPIAGRIPLPKLVSAARY